MSKDIEANKDTNTDVKKITSMMEAVDVTDKVEKITTWLPPSMVTLSDTKVRMTAVDGASQLYGHQKEAKNKIRSMKACFKERYEVEDHPEDLKTEWSVGEVCVAKLGEHWYRAQIVEMNNTRRYAGIIYVDLGNVREIDISDLRIPRAFAKQPILAIRMVLESVIPTNGDKAFPPHTLEAIQEQIGYWNAGFVKVTSTRKVSAFPIPVKLYLVQDKGESVRKENFGRTLRRHGLADKGEVNLSNPDYKLHARVL